MTEGIRLVDSGGQPTTVIEWGWAYRNKIVAQETEAEARVKVMDNGGAVVRRYKVFPPPLVSAWRATTLIDDLEMEETVGQG